MNYRYAVNGSLLFQELPLLARPDAIAAAGFTAAEFWWPFAVAVPADAEVEAFCRAIEDSGLDLIGLNFFAGDMPAGDRGIVSWPGREAEFRDNVEIVVAMGERLGCRAFNALYGNRLAAVTPEQQDVDVLVRTEPATDGELDGVTAGDPPRGGDALEQVRHLPRGQRIPGAPRVPDRPLGRRPFALRHQPSRPAAKGVRRHWSTIGSR